MGPVTTLLKTARSLSGRTTAWDTAKNRQPTFPHNGCANFLSALLDLSGLGVGTHLLAQDLAVVLEKQAGWARVEVADYRAGDIGVTDAVIDPPNADHIYLVLMHDDANDMTVVDNQADSPNGVIHARTVAASGTFTRTHYFLRYANDVAVSVNGTVIADAEGYIHQARSFGWIRPIANALGLDFNLIGDSITLGLNGQEVQRSTSVFSDQAFVALDDLERLNGIQVVFNAPTNIVDITHQ